VPTHNGRMAPPELLMRSIRLSMCRRVTANSHLPTRKCLTW
jgi:hypothetical protein